MTVTSSLVRRLRSRFLLALSLTVSLAFSNFTPQLLAIPNTFIGGQFIGPVVPAHPRFNANLTAQFLNASNWEKAEFPGPWKSNAESAPNGAGHAHMTAMPVLFGAVPESVARYTRGGRLREVVVTYLDAGTFFNYQPGGEKTHAERKSGAEQRSDFAHHYAMLSSNLQHRLEQGCGQGEQTVLGRSRLLRSVHIDYRWEDFVIRLTRRDNHSIELRLMRQGDRIDSLVDDRVSALDRAAWRRQLNARVASNERGDSLIDGIPMSTQGFTPYCGIHSLEMAGQYLGLRLRSDELAAAARFRNTGSARGSKILELYHAAAEELGMKLSVSSRFDFDRARRSIEAGVPVIVWRRVCEEREAAHSATPAKLSEQPMASLPPLTRSDRAGLPVRSKKGSPSHASVISGINAEQEEVIFTDPWGEAARDKHMHVEEMEATAYTVFYFEI